MGRMIIFLAIITTILGVGHAYVGWRLIVPAKLSPPWLYVAWGSVVVLALLHPFAFSFRLRNVNLDALAWLSYILLGAFALVFAFVAIRDVVWALSLGIDWLTARFLDDAPKILPEDPERRRALLHTLNLGIMGAGGVGTAVGFYQARKRATVVTVDIPVKDLPDALDGFSIAQISDIHVGPTIKGDYLAGIVSRVNELGADVIAVTGDLVDGSVEELSPHVAPLSDLKAKHGAFFVTGNHEYYSGAPAWVEHVNRLGLTTLMNEHRTLEHNGERVLMCGVTDYTAETIVESHRSDPEKAAKDAPSTGARVLLAHQPRSVFAAQKVAVGPERRSFDLMLSGHTHGGQFLPWSFLVGLANPVNAGLKAFDVAFPDGNGAAQKMWVYVNSGTGYWGPPLRLGIPSEITLLKLRRA